MIIENLLFQLSNKSENEYLCNMSNLLTEDIKFLTGVGPKKALVLNSELKVFTFQDLLYCFPYKYVDRTRFYSIREIDGSMPYIQIKGFIESIELIGEGHKARLNVMLKDATGRIELVWFQGIKWIRPQLKMNTEFVVFGKPTEFNNKINMVHPEIEEVGNTQASSVGFLQAFYNTSEKMKKNYLGSKAVLKLQFALFPLVRQLIQETLPDWLVDKYRLMSLPDALQNIHFPESAEKLKLAQFRLKFEELFYIQLKILGLKSYRSNKFRGNVFSKVGENFNRFYSEKLPFNLTDAQKRVIREIRKDSGSGTQMNRLLQGDVGSGKTLVALMCMLISVDNGFQSCLMAPTEILAKQHFLTLSKFVEGLNVTISLLTGSTRIKERRIIHGALEDGSLNILVGTHALIENKVVFKNLGFVVVDEQHRFGVAQRARLWEKNSTPPHMLVMTATPIPRTLAMTLYGDLDVSIIDELPPGRKPIKTLNFFDNKRKQVFSFIRDEIQKGRQIYIVYPLIEESEKIDLKNLTDGFETLKRVFPDIEIGMVHGKMKPAEKDAEMIQFKEGYKQILVATTVIEVGVDVPNASVMVIESAERFGLSQLHQLRGRVGRGADQSYCILMSTHKLSNESRKRIETMVRTNDGFEIAETDLQLRGPGDIEGTVQSGIGVNLRIANLGKDGEILQHARNVASDIISDDQLLQKPENQLFRKELKQMQKTNFNWSTIS